MEVAENKQSKGRKADTVGLLDAPRIMRLSGSLAGYTQNVIDNIDICNQNEGRRTRKCKSDAFRHVAVCRGIQRTGVPKISLAISDPTTCQTGIQTHCDRQKIQHQKMHNERDAMAETALPHCQNLPPTTAPATNEHRERPHFLIYFYEVLCPGYLASSLYIVQIEILLLISLFVSYRYLKNIKEEIILINILK